mmetsp:Transcript_98221/g.305815  ORF Transcript_98221/g.305815 Transcript_98221/m.305815 type:complete len:219 (+) Transcript_98221:713-1369(+)
MSTPKVTMPKFSISPPTSWMLVRASCTAMAAGVMTKASRAMEVMTSSPPICTPALSFALSAPVRKPRTTPLMRPMRMHRTNNPQTNQLICQRASLMRAVPSSLSAFARSSSATFPEMGGACCKPARWTSDACDPWSARARTCCGGGSRRMPEAVKLAACDDEGRRPPRPAAAVLDSMSAPASGGPSSCRQGSSSSSAAGASVWAGGAHLLPSGLYAWL